MHEKLAVVEAINRQIQHENNPVLDIPIRFLLNKFDDLDGINLYAMTDYDPSGMIHFPCIEMEQRYCIFSDNDIEKKMIENYLISNYYHTLNGTNWSN